MGKESRVHIIIINYRTWEFTLKCLDSLRLSSYHDFKVWIVDVKNLDNSYQNISEHLNSRPQLESEIIRLNENLGFSGANNAALNRLPKQNKSAFIWLLNNDTIVEPTTLEHLVKAYNDLENENKIPGILGPKIMEGDQPNLFQAAGGTFNPSKGLIQFNGQGQTDTGQYGQTNSEVDFLLGASMFLSLETLNEIGLMDEQYFLYCEDIDWCITARNKGYRNYFVPSSKIFHYQGASTGTKYQQQRKSTNTIKYLHSSYLKLYRKFYPKRVRVAYFQLSKLMLSKITKGNFAEAKVIFGVLKNSLNKNPDLN